MFAPQDHFAKMTAPDRVNAWRWGLCMLHTLKTMQPYHQAAAWQKRPPWGGLSCIASQCTADRRLQTIAERRALSFLQNDGWVRKTQTVEAAP